MGRGRPAIAKITCKKVFFNLEGSTEERKRIGESLEGITSIDGAGSIRQRSYRREKILDVVRVSSLNWGKSLSRS